MRSFMSPFIQSIANSSPALCQQQVHRPAARRLLCLHQTRPRAISALGSNAAAPAPSLSSSRGVLPCSPAARVDDLAQNLDERHVRFSSSRSPPRHAHTVLRRRSVDRLLLLRGSIKGATNNRGHALLASTRILRFYEAYTMPIIEDTMGLSRSIEAALEWRAACSG